MKEFEMESGIILKYAPAYASKLIRGSEKLIQELWKIAKMLLLESKMKLNYGQRPLWFLIG